MVEKVLPVSIFDNAIKLLARSANEIKYLHQNPYHRISKIMTGLKSRVKRVQNALDMGCGSGILALAIAKRWKCRVSASDIDVVAKQTAQTNAVVNGLRRYLDIYVGPGYSNRSLKN